MERVETHDRVRSPYGDDVADPVGTACGHGLQTGAAIGAEGVEELAHHGLDRPLAAHTTRPVK